MSNPENNTPEPTPEALFARVAAILDQARGNVVRAVNTQMVQAYWLIGREIVESLQDGEDRAGYGKKLFENLSERLAACYGKGFSVRNLRWFKKLYITYSDRFTILHPMGAEFRVPPKLHPLGAESSILSPLGIESDSSIIKQPHSDQSVLGFSPHLTWSHYRALTQVDNTVARDFYEHEAIEGGWDKRTLERQIQTSYFERHLKSAKPEQMVAEGRQLPVPATNPADTLKNPYILEFLGLPDVAAFHESDLESAIIAHLQRFLMELGNGFAFVSRQKHLRIEEQDRYIDLLFYHCRLKFYLLIDLKIGELSHADVGQMDGYVRMVDDLIATPDDNPTIGLILCTEKNETVARYSVLNDRKQIFASKYMLFLPTEEQLRLEIEKELRLLKENLSDNTEP